MDDQQFETAQFSALNIKTEVHDNFSQEVLCFASKSDDSSVLFDSEVKVEYESSAKLNSLKKALLLNAEIRALVEADIQKIKVAYEKNLEKQAILSKFLKEETTATIYGYKPVHQHKAISVFASPYFRDVKRMVPPDNEDTKIKKKNCDVNAYLKPPRPWTQSENKSLLNGITGFALMSALKPYKMKRDKLKEKLKNQNLLDFEIGVLVKQLARVENRIKAISEKPLQELLDEIEGKIDWMIISSVYMEGTREPSECENMWNNFLNFSINKEAFSKEEDERLHNLAEDHNERDWDFIARSLHSNRTPIQCFERYQTRLSTNLHRRFWTKEEDERLIALVNELKCGEIIPWNRVSLLMEGRTRQQCINRYDRSISQAYNRGPWTTEEDAILIACYHKFGVHWNKMKYFFKRRSIYSIRERYVNSLDPSLKMGCWTKEEDRLLISLIKQYGYGKWSKICKKLPGRTDNMCMIRAGKLLEYSIKFCSDKGTEIDPGVYDPELFAKILKPLAPSKVCILRNTKLRSCRKNAVVALMKALNKVLPDFKVEDENSFNLSWLSSENLQQISEELHSMLRKKEEQSEPFFPHIRYFTTERKEPRFRRKRQLDEDNDVELQTSPVKFLTVKEKEALNSELDAMLNLHYKNVQYNTKRKPQVFNAREVAEMSLYKAYLYEQFSCSAVCDDGDDIENVNFCGIDYSETLHTVVSYFIQPPIYKNQFIVLAPNLTTVRGLESIEFTENRLLSMSECVSHSKNYMDYICERKKSCPKCLQCLCKSDRLDPKVESVIENLKNKQFIVTEAMEISAHVEAASTEKCIERCSCVSLQESQKSVQLLRKRFMALFLWPSLLAMTNFSNEQNLNLCKKQTTNKDYFMRLRKAPPTPQHKKRGRKKKIPEAKTEPPSFISSVDSNETSHSFTSNVSSSLPAPEIVTTGVTVPKVKKQYKRKRENCEVLRRSKRTCVLMRTSFAFTEIKEEDSS